MEKYVETQVELNDHEDKILHANMSQKYLVEILSPLERAIIKNDFKPFIHEVGGQKVYISIAVQKKLLRSIVSRYELLFYQDLKEQRSTNIPTDRRELFDSIGVILDFYPWLRNKLWDMDCYNLYRIMRKGRAYFVVEQKFPKKAVETLDKVFAKYQCSHLFI